MTQLAFSKLDLEVDGVGLRLATMHRDGSRLPIVFLHGFGSTKEDYADVALLAAFDGRPVFAYDAPGCGESVCDDLSAVSVPFLVRTAQAALDAAGIDRFHLVGHSMGGLTALLLADEGPRRVLSFVDIEGNVAPEDCFLSRQIITHAAPDPDAFFDAFIERARRLPASGSALYAASLRHKVRAGAVRPIFESMVERSDHGDLLRRFLGLPFPRMFMYGAENAGLTYLGTLAAGGVELAEIPACGHFPMYSNAVEMWTRIAAFLPLD
jgi:pimeloyl-ACP methyl ester carboxylesterase